MDVIRKFVPYRTQGTRFNDKIVEISGRPVPGVGFVTTYTDVTEQVSAEKVVRESEARFRDFAELGSDWFWEMGPDLTFSYHSQRYYEITGFRPEDKIGTPRTRYVDPDALDTASEKWAEHMADLEARRPFRNFEYEFAVRDGSTINVRISGAPVFGENGEFAGYRGIGTDITAMVQSARALRASEEQFSAFVENLPAFVNLKDRDGHYLLINRKHTEMFGYHQRSLVGRVISEFRHEKHASAATLQEQEVLEHRAAITHERKMDTSEGTRDFLVTKFPIFDDAGEIAHIGTIGTDITLLTEAQAALAAAMAEAEAANRSKSDFLAAMSHDLRTPLNAIIGFADAIRLQYFGGINERYQEYAGDIRWSGEHLLSLIGDILDVTAIEAGRMELTKQDIDRDEIVAECRTIISGEARTLGISVETELPDELPPLHADRQAVKKILLNLLTNALKFTTGEGTITVAVTQAETQAGMRHVIEVRDTGIGIPKERIASITDPFVKGGANPYQAQDGAGLGLAIVKSLVQMHDGALDIESIVGEGTVVTVRLPSG